MLASVLEFSRWVFGNRRVRVRGGIDTEFDSVTFSEERPSISTSLGVLPATPIYLLKGLPPRSLATPRFVRPHFFIFLIKRGWRALRSREINALTKPDRARRPRTSPTARPSFYEPAAAGSPTPTAAVTSNGEHRPHPFIRYTIYFLFLPGVKGDATVGGKKPELEKKERTTRKIVRAAFTQRYAIPSR